MRSECSIIMGRNGLFCHVYNMVLDELYGQM